MGLDINGTRFLLYAKRQGICFAKTAMLGRQRLYLHKETLRKSLIDFGYCVSSDQVKHLLGERDGYAEPFLEFLGATETCSFDASDYENATNIHDFNLPIDESFKNRFTVVLDSGSLEHIFNFPMAIKNCLGMIEVGGHFLGITHTNNHCGHGFYQFSPELFFRIFSASNGFKLLRIILCEDSLIGKWFEVTDPATIGRRVTLINSFPLNLLIIAKKVEFVPLFATGIQQSDYSALWNAQMTAELHLFSGAIRRFMNFVPTPVKILYGIIRGYRGHFFRYNPRFFKRMRIP